MAQAVLLFFIVRVVEARDAAVFSGENRKVDRAIEGIGDLDQTHFGIRGVGEVFLHVVLRHAEQWAVPKWIESAGERQLV